MRFLVTLARKRNGISRHYDVVVSAQNAQDARRRASRRRPGMSVWSVVTLEGPTDLIESGKDTTRR